MQSIKCSQCNKPAYGYSKGKPYCLDCSVKITEINSKMLATSMKMTESLKDTMDAIAGLPPQRAQIQRPTNLTYNNFKIDHSSIGAINTGTISGSLKNINARLTIMRDSTELIHGLKSLTETIVNSPEIPQDQKQELLEFISVITDEMIKPHHERKQAIIQIVLKTMSDYANIILAIQTIWNVVHPLLITFFQ